MRTRVQTSLLRRSIDTTHDTPVSILCMRPCERRIHRHSHAKRFLPLPYIRRLVNQGINLNVSQQRIISQLIQSSGRCQQSAPIEVTTKHKTVEISLKKFSLSKKFLAPKGTFLGLCGNFSHRKKIPHTAKKVQYLWGREKLLREKISMGEISRIWSFVVT